jgi:sugar O-acyltransferase (sialic acid O-acetyltransferase NeuD family)
MENKLIALLGAGGMASEILNWIKQSHYNIDYLYDGTIIKDLYLIHGKNQYTISNKFRKNSSYIIAVGYPKTKATLLKNIEEEIHWADPIVHPSCILGDSVFIGNGSIVCPYVVITANTTIDKLASINTLVTIGHNCEIGEMFHASPNSTISGDVTIGDRVFLGANACIREKTTICDDVLIGIGTVIVKNITEPGIYAGNPAKKINELEYAKTL